MKKPVCYVIGFLLMLPLSGWATDFILKDKEVKSLTTQALELYRKGQNDIDYVRYEMALDDLIAAEKADPGNIPIRFLTAKLAAFEANKKQGVEAVDFYRKAETALNEILALKDQAKISDIKRAQSELDLIRDHIVKQAERDQRRQKIGKEIVKERAKEIFADQLKAEEKKAAEKAALEKQKGQPKKPAATPAVPAMSPGMMMM